MYGMMDFLIRRRAATLTAAFAIACSSTGVSTATRVPGAAPAPTAASGDASNGGADASVRENAAWRVVTMEHVDLWFHGFAMLTSDTGYVPFFARGYRQRITTAKRLEKIVTLLDVNQPSLSARFATTPSLANAQFLAMYFSSFAEMVSVTDQFLRAAGNPRTSYDPQIQQQLGLLAATFPRPEDRNWLSLFILSLQDENTKFFHPYWLTEQRARGPAFAQFAEEWRSRFYVRLTRFLNNTQQTRGQVILSIPIGGEGRTVNDGKQSNLVAVSFPKSLDSTSASLYVFAHEAVAGVVQEAIRDNTTPAEQRTSAAGTYAGNGAVRGGALLLQRALPESAPGYMRYYLRIVGKTPPAGDPSAAFSAAFPLPPAIVTGIGGAITLALGGI